MNYWKEKKKSSIGCFFESCSKSFLQFELKQLLQEAEFQQYEAFSVTELIESNNSFLKCPNPGCTEVIERVPFVGDRRGMKFQHVCLFQLCVSNPIRLIPR
jgi:hypothetical protein